MTFTDEEPHVICWDGKKRFFGRDWICGSDIGAIHGIVMWTYLFIWIAWWLCTRGQAQEQGEEGEEQKDEPEDEKEEQEVKKYGDEDRAEYGKPAGRVDLESGGEILHTEKMG